MSHPKRIGHVVLNVKDVEESTKFYTEVLGFHISKQSEILLEMSTVTATFLTCGKIHHDLALFQSRIPYKTKDGLGLNHIAIQVEDFEALTAYYRILEPMNVIERCTDHGMTKSIYLTDPDGNGIELFCNSQENPAEGLKLMGSPDRKNKELVFASPGGYFDSMSEMAWNAPPDK